MDDLISRQAAIDALGGNEPVGDPSKMDDDDVVKMWERIRIINIINKLPSAQPEIIRCMDCKHYKDGECTNTFWGMCEKDYCSEGERKDNESES